MSVSTHLTAYVSSTLFPALMGWRFPCVKLTWMIWHRHTDKAYYHLGWWWYFYYCCIKANIWKVQMGLFMSCDIHRTGFSSPQFGSIYLILIVLNHKISVCMDQILCIFIRLLWMVLPYKPCIQRLLSPAAYPSLSMHIINYHDCLLNDGDHVRGYPRETVTTKTQWA